MGVPFLEQPVRGSDGWPLSGATSGSVRPFEAGVLSMHHMPDKAMASFHTALRLAPTFVMAHAAMAHLVLSEDPAAGRAMTRLLAPFPRTDREASHLAILAGWGGDRADTSALDRHLAAWPDDTLATALLGAMQATRPLATG
ncbi:hypothetical protein [Sagittula sp.]|uniref:hypothetical protein n=1 Tax=Sagittula sp. TaxID=2038081 RepID=UPI003517C097